MRLVVYTGSFRLGPGAANSRPSLYKDTNMNTKKCPKCQQFKATSEFHRNKCNRDGLQTYCKRCHVTSKPTPQHLFDHWMKKIGELEGEELKHAARLISTHAHKLGILIRPNTCSKCSKPCKTQAHHCDYHKPLDVKYYCQSCHQKLHAALNPNRKMAHNALTNDDYDKIYKLANEGVLSQVEISKTIGCNNGTISKILSGKCTGPRRSKTSQIMEIRNTTGKTYKLIAEELGISEQHVAKVIRRENRRIKNETTK